MDAETDSKSGKPLGAAVAAAAAAAASATPSAFVTSLMDSFSFWGDNATAQSQEFLNGNSPYVMDANATQEEKNGFYHQCLRALDWSFSDKTIRDKEVLYFFAGSIEDMEAHLNIAFDGGLRDAEVMRELLPLDSIPFRFARRYLVRNIQELPKDDEVRLACQALFLFLLRARIPLKYSTPESFLAKYPELRDRSLTEQERLRHTANWMDLTFYTVQPRNNKTFVLNLIPRIVEGRNARYITGSGQTKPTADRVNLFRIEGSCEKIKRPPRRKKEEILAAAVSSLGKKNSALESMVELHPYMHVNYPMGFLAPGQWMQYPHMNWPAGFPALAGGGKGGDPLHASQVAALRCAGNGKTDPSMQSVSYLMPSFWAGGVGVDTNAYARSPSPYAPYPNGLAAPTAVAAAAPAHSAVKGDPKSPDGVRGGEAAVLGKRKLESDDSPAKIAPAGGGLHLLFAAVHSIESATTTN